MSDNMASPAQQAYLDFTTAKKAHFTTFRVGTKEQMEVAQAEGVLAAAMATERQADTLDRIHGMIMRALDAPLKVNAIVAGEGGAGCVKLCTES